MSRLLRAAFAVACLSSLLLAQTPQNKYLLLATTKTGTMQKELDEASAKGYRIVVGAPTSGAEMVLLLDKQEEGSKAFQYRLLATTRTSTMEKELNEAAQGGFRLLPRTMISKPPAMFGSIEVVSVMEKDPNSTKKYHYKLLATTLTSTLQKEIEQTMKDGYVLVGMVSRGEHMVIMEKASEQ